MGEQTGDHNPIQAAAQQTAPPGAAAAGPAAAAPVEELNEDGTPLTEKQKKKRAEKAEKQRIKEEKAAKIAAEKAAKENEVDFAAQNYGQLPLNQSQERHGIEFTPLGAISAERDGERVFVQARLQLCRSTSAKLAFLVLRNRFDCVQAVLAETPDQVSRKMVKWTASLPVETLLNLEASISKTAKPIESSVISVKDAELKIHKIHSLGAVVPTADQKFSVQDATRSEAEIEASQSTEQPMPSIGLDTRLDNRVLDLRTTTNQAIFRLTHGVCRLFREFLDTKDFIEIHSPKLQGAATESGASVFKVSYFKGQAFLAQSPQLAKQMAIAADFGRVYEIGPVFRAEDSNTPRHMTEFTGLDLEMAFSEHYHEVLDLMAELFTFIFRELPKRYRKEIDTVKRQYPTPEFLVPAQPVRLNWKEGIKMLREAGSQIGELEDMDTETERLLGKLVREKYNTDFFMLDKFPLDIRPFYTMPDPTDSNYSNSYDFFMRGQEILSGAQRVHDPDLLAKRMEKAGIPVSAMQGYFDAFRLGAPPHAGGGIGLERVVMLYLGLRNIRLTSLFPRDPKRLEP
ncbi:aspartyl-tRNA synthetase [Tilletiaria anomala UBC 951]|uniref:aspartate--tRNA ligase n=1 Tax=Tilletiaria anomala (strain ATCC 24038 / CBS 436.72 / UBC 951) TaxID=1037660 RepID=A0A066W6K7_TILAU|nr:aspartyl-tRNA synthetase [Tilletiaria anomala UBC 951]KDN49617.1 aspartyl-tRNA synthetase [Tilletiaria anomala UBC 951]